MTCINKQWLMNVKQQRKFKIHQVCNVCCEPTPMQYIGTYPILPLLCRWEFKASM